MKKNWNKKEVVELINEYENRIRGRVVFEEEVNKFLKDKGLLEEELEKDVWYIRKGEEGCLAFFYNGDDSYGFNCFEDWRDKLDYTIKEIQNKYDWYRKATKEEVEPLLIAEAKRRGLVEGVEFNDAWDGSKEIIGGGFMIDFSDGGLWSSEGKYCVFYEGKWATLIITEELTIEQIQEKLGYKIKIVE